MYIWKWTSFFKIWQNATEFALPVSDLSKCLYLKQQQMLLFLQQMYCLKDILLVQSFRSLLG